MRGAIVFSDHVPRRCLFLISIAGSVLLTGCADTRGGTIPYDRPFAAPDEVKFQTLETNYKIAPMDKLAIKVFKMDDLSGDYDVDLAGNISLPLIGQIEAANLTTAQLDDQLTQKLGAKYLEHPDVSVAIKSSTAHVVTVDGAVREGGSFPVGGPISLIQAVAMAKGTTEDANARRVAVFRTISGQRQAAAFDLTSIRRGQSPDPQIYPGDIVVVDGSSIKAAQKQILQSFPLLSIFRPF
jgi:polysaccharide export outer membrane protein